LRARASAAAAGGGVECVRGEKLDGSPEDDAEEDAGFSCRKEEQHAGWTNDRPLTTEV
jgi:hypothetical protein